MSCHQGNHFWSKCRVGCLVTLLIICSLLSKMGMGYISNFRDSAEDLPSFFEVLKKCRHKCNKMLYIKQLRPRLNMQTDSTHCKVFVSKPYSLYANLEYFNSFQSLIYICPNPWKWCHEVAETLQHYLIRFCMFMFLSIIVVCFISLMWTECWTTF